MDVKIIVVTHKDYQMPSDPMYMPICVGSGIECLKHRFQPDNTGDNISDKNPCYCELTALYWAWKNLSADYLGIAHYRRHFSLKSNVTDIAAILTMDQIVPLLKQYAVLVPSAKKYPVISVKNHYIHSKKGYKSIHRQDFIWLEEAIKERAGEYIASFHSVINGNTAHMLNMFIMRSDLLCSYCEWLFAVIDLFVQKAVLRPDQRRFAGALSEFLLDVWLTHNAIPFKEIFLLETEPVSLIKKVYNRVNHAFRI